MKNRQGCRLQHVFILAACTALFGACTERGGDPGQAAAPAEVEAGTAASGSAVFQPIFDGKTLAGWRGDATIWSVRDDAITGGSDQDIPRNTFLIYERPYGNFELRYSYRMDGDGNSGFQFRSVVADEGNFIVKGYQANVVPIGQAERFGMLYEEGGRRELALLGHKMEISSEAGQLRKNVLEATNPREKLIQAVRPYPEWNEVVVIAFGNRLLHALNGYLVYDAIDNDPAARSEGVLGIQVHSGPPMYVQFKDIQIAELTEEPSIDGRFMSERGPPTPADPGQRVPRAPRQ